MNVLCHIYYLSSMKANTNYSNNIFNTNYYYVLISDAGNFLVRHKSQFQNLCMSHYFS